MAAIVENPIRRSVFLNNPVQELRVRLIPDADLDLIFGESPASRVDVDPDNARTRSEKPLPHLQRAPHTAADLYEDHVGIDEFPEMSLIDRKIVLPFKEPLQKPAASERDIMCIGTDWCAWVGG